jgi:sec-independent protein translocase protein TatA
MFGGKLGLGELLIILLIVLVLFGANKLPQIGAGLGQSIRDFKKALSGDDEKPATPPASDSSDKGAPKA